jgi:phosphocarrier protein HPr
MRAIVFDRYGEPDVMSSRKVPVPEPQAGAVLIRVGYAGVNPSDSKARLEDAARAHRADKMEKEIAIVNCFGLHLRHAGRFAQMANRFRADIWVAKDGTEVNGKSILGLITLGATQGSRLRIGIEGADAAEAMQEIERLIQSWFDEDQI